MGRLLLAAVRAMARCSPSTRMAPVLRSSTASLAAPTEPIRGRDWCYRATPCLARRIAAAVAAPEQCSPSITMAAGLRTCIGLQGEAMGPTPLVDVL